MKPRQFKHNKLGIIITQVKTNWYQDNDICVPPSIVENSSDWTEIVEKDWEAVSVKTKLGKIIETNDYFEYLLAHDCVTIYSVKRLSDNIVFTVGDRVAVGTAKTESAIIKFDIIDDLLWVTGDKFAYFPISKLSKPTKTPLFTTHDKVEVYDNKQVVFAVNKAAVCMYGEVSAESFKLMNCDFFIAFSTEQAAQDYINLNAPCLSVQDLITRTDWSLPFRTLGKNPTRNETIAVLDAVVIELKKLAQSKLSK